MIADRLEEIRGDGTVPRRNEGFHRHAGYKGEAEQAGEFAFGYRDAGTVETLPRLFVSLQIGGNANDETGKFRRSIPVEGA